MEEDYASCVSVETRLCDEKHVAAQAGSSRGGKEKARGKSRVAGVTLKQTTQL